MCMLPPMPDIQNVRQLLVKCLHIVTTGCRSGGGYLVLLPLEGLTEPRRFAR